MRAGGDPNTRLLAVCLAASLAAHAVIVAWVPGVHRHPQDELPAILSVELRRTPLPVAPQSPLAEAYPEEKPALATPARPPPRAAPPQPRARPPTSSPAIESPARVAPPAAEPPVPASTTSDATAPPPRSAGSAETAPPEGAETAARTVPPSYGAAYLRNPAPRYPVEARREGAEGTVLLRVWVGADGAAIRVEVDRSSGHRALDAAALAAVRSWRFVPAQRGGEAVEGIVTVPLVFRLDARG